MTVRYSTRAVASPRQPRQRVCRGCGLLLRRRAGRLVPDSQSRPQPGPSGGDRRARRPPGQDGLRRGHGRPDGSNTGRPLVLVDLEREKERVCFGTLTKLALATLYEGLPSSTWRPGHPPVRFRRRTPFTRRRAAAGRDGPGLALVEPQPARNQAAAGAEPVPPPSSGCRCRAISVAGPCPPTPVAFDPCVALVRSFAPQAAGGAVFV